MRLALLKGTIASLVGVVVKETCGFRGLAGAQGRPSVSPKRLAGTDRFFSETYIMVLVPVKAKAGGTDAHGM